jgi:hypothetical protein
MHPYLLQEIARLHEEELRRAARQYGPAEPRSHRPTTAARTIRPGGGPMRSKPLILAALLLAAFLVSLDTALVNVALPALVRQLPATTTQLHRVVHACNLVFAALLLTLGSLPDRLAARRSTCTMSSLATAGRGSYMMTPDSPANTSATRLAGISPASSRPSATS